MTTLRINITKEVLQATKDCKEAPGKNCAVAYAIREIWPFAHVDDYQIFPFAYKAGNFHDGFRHNQDSFTLRFDLATPAERAAMQPFSFEIEVPDEVIGEVNIEEIRRICDGSKTLELI